MFSLNKKITIFIICLILLYIFLHKSKTVEGYDGRISNITEMNKCADICIKTYDCQGFSYNEKDKKCFISKSPIVGYPFDSPYKGEFNDKNKVCNKINMIDTNTEINEDALLTNRIFNCSDEIDGSFKTIFFDKDLKDLDMTNVKDITNFEKVPYELKNIKWGDETTINIDTDITTNEPIVKEKVKISFLEKTKDTSGEFLYPHRCVSNIKKNECLKQCEQNKDCIGVEWNPRVITDIENSDGGKTEYLDVCCPKKTLGTYVLRKPNVQNGLFYEKYEGDFESDNISNVIIQ